MWEFFSHFTILFNVLDIPGIILEIKFLLKLSSLGQSSDHENYSPQFNSYLLFFN